MERNIEAAVKLYSGEKPWGLFVPHLVENLKDLNDIFEEISDLFVQEGIENFEKLPTDLTVCVKFAKYFKEFNEHLEAAKIQGFQWKVSHYEEKETGEVIDTIFNGQQYLVLVLRYKELAPVDPSSGTSDDVPYDLVSYITEIDTGRIDADYMNSRFEKYLKLL